MVTGGIVILLIVGVFFYGFNATRKNFRRMLAEELNKWQDEGIVDRLQAIWIRRKYNLHNLARESQSLLVKTIFIIFSVVIMWICVIRSPSPMIYRNSTVITFKISLAYFHKSQILIGHLKEAVFSYGWLIPLDKSAQLL
jgi:hypothetical protein